MGKVLGNDDELREVFSKRIRELRLERDLTLKVLSKMLLDKYELDISYGAIANYERAERVPQPFGLVCLADFFDVTVDFLLGITDDRNIKVIQTTVFDTNNKEHTVKIGIDKDSDLSDMKVKDVKELILKIKNLGFDINSIK